MHESVPCRHLHKTGGGFTRSGGRPDGWNNLHQSSGMSGGIWVSPVFQEIQGNEKVQ